MTSGLARFGRPTSLTCNLGTSGTLPNHTPGQAYSGTFSVTNRVGEVTAELVSATPALPAGWSLQVNQATGVVTLAWPAATPSGSLPNLGFETGTADWQFGNGWVVDSAALVESGTQSAKYNGVGQSFVPHVQAVPVTPGQTITASARISKGTNRADFAGGAVLIYWLNAAGEAFAQSVGNIVNTGSSAFQTSTVTGTAPAGAVFARLIVYADRDVKGRARDRVYVDNVSWSHTYALGGGQATNYAVVIRVRDGRGCQATLSQTINQGLPQTLALLHFDGTNGSTSFPDDTGRVWTRSGDAQISTTNPRFGTGSARFDGSGDFIETPTNNGLAFGTGAFTIEFWIRFTGAANDPEIITCRNMATSGGWYIRAESDGRIHAWEGSGADGARSTTVAVNDGLWHHYAYCREAGAPGVCRIFLDGVQQGASFNRPTDYSAATVNALTRVGAWLVTAPGGNFFNGNIDELRISNTARYTANFTPPAAPFTID